jgi:hypothetical protein
VRILWHFFELRISKMSWTLNRIKIELKRLNVAQWPVNHSKS